MGPPLDMSLILRILLSCLLGGLIGLEREVHGRPAGFRTHLLVSLGSCLFVISSVEFYRHFGNQSGGPLGVDPGRVAAQVVTGIGFLGAGAIIRDKASIRGLTTAACLWVAAAVGLACGIGLFYLAIFVTLVALVNLMLLKQVEKRLSRDTYLLVRMWGEESEGYLPRVMQGLQAVEVAPLNLKFDRDLAHRRLLMEFHVKLGAAESSSTVLEKLGTLAGIQRVKVE